MCLQARLPCVQRRELFELYWLRIPGVGARHLSVLSQLTAGHSVEEAYRWVCTQLPGPLREELERFAPSTLWGRDVLVAAQRDLDWLQENEAHVLRPGDTEFPGLLGEIHDPPPLLFVQRSRTVPTLLPKWPSSAVVAPRPAGARWRRHSQRTWPPWTWSPPAV